MRRCHEGGSVGEEEDVDHQHVEAIEKRLVRGVLSRGVP
jgi:hypothetical protein